MNVQTFPRAVIGSSLRVARVPVDRVLRFGGDSDSAGSARIFVDRLDATVREIAGTLMRDDVLLDDAQRRQAAADQRERALRLRAEAEFHAEQGDKRASEALREAESRRRKAEEDAKERRRQAERRRNAKKSGAAKSAQTKKRAAQKTGQKRQRSIKEQGERERLESLETKSDALELKQKAITAADESRRLADTASKAKQSRKRRGS